MAFNTMFNVSRIIADLTIFLIFLVILN